MKKWTLIPLVLIAFTLTASAETPARDCSKDSTYPQISKAELKKVTDAGQAFVVDVNSQESFDKAHVTGAIHYGSHKADFAKMLPAKKDALIVAYCGGPQCTAWKKAAEEACKQGYTHIKHFKEGIKGWVAKN